MKLMNYGFNTFAYQKLFTAGDVVGAIPVEKGEKENVSLLAASDVGATSQKNGETSFSYELEVPECLPAPIEQGMQVGNLILQKEGRAVKEIPLLAAENVAKKSWSAHWQAVLQAIFTF
jgi:D-alanyl-D-alanine carboxypeptidase (penicillin-binding protein 5/6)